MDPVTRRRAERDRFFAEHYASPIPEEERSGFTGLDYFPPDPRWRLRGRWLPAGGDARVEIDSSTGSRSAYRLVGRVVLPLEGEEVVLAVLDDGDGGRFLPFRDATSGATTYGGGRYVPVVVDGDVAVVDFNDARNPFCAYDEEFSCPLPPPGNRLPVAVEAGERRYRRPGG